MKYKFFKSVRFERDWELDLFIGKYQLRIGRSQIALWKDLKPVFNSWVNK
jgi:hypothetical protein